MIKLRDTLKKSDIEKIRNILKGTGFFDAAPDEIDVAAELVEIALTGGNDIENYKIIIAEETQIGDVAGYVCFARVPCSVSTFEIYWIAVNKAIQGKGVGRILINEVEKIAQKYKAKKLILYTAGREQYAPTHKFYEIAGFSEEARIKDYYASKDDCIIYSKQIKG